MYQFWEELSAEDLENLKKPIKKVIFPDANTVQLSVAFIAEYFFKLIRIHYTLWGNCIWNLEALGIDPFLPWEHFSLFCSTGAMWKLYERAHKMDTMMSLGNPPFRCDLIPIFHNQGTSNSLTIPTGHDNRSVNPRLNIFLLSLILLHFCRVLLKMKTMTFWKEKLLKMMVWLKLLQILMSPTHGALWAALAPLQTVTCHTHCDMDNQKGRGWKLCAMFCSGKRLELNFPNWQIFK